MIPYLEIPPLKILGLQFDAFGILVATGFLVGFQAMLRRAKQIGQNPIPLHDIAILAIVCGFVGAHVMHMVGYYPDKLLKEPWKIFYVWSGISSYGGFLGAGLGIWYYTRRKGLPFQEYGDTLMFGMIPGWIFGRLGCYTAHDHPGLLTDFILSVKYPGGNRHDLGFYDALLAICIGVVVYSLGRKNGKERPAGFYLALTMLLYGVPRFFFDFLRATDLSYSDRRYFGLTPAQYVSIAFTIYGVTKLLQLHRKPNTA